MEKGDDIFWKTNACIQIAKWNNLQIQRICLSRSVFTVVHCSFSPGMEWKNFQTSEWNKSGCLIIAQFFLNFYSQFVMMLSILFASKFTFVASVLLTVSNSLLSRGTQTQIKRMHYDKLLVLFRMQQMAPNCQRQMRVGLYHKPTMNSTHSSLVLFQISTRKI